MGGRGKGEDLSLYFKSILHSVPPPVRALSGSQLIPELSSGNTWCTYLHHARRRGYEISGLDSHTDELFSCHLPQTVSLLCHISEGASMVSTLNHDFFSKTSAQDSGAPCLERRFVYVKFIRIDRALNATFSKTEGRGNKDKITIA